MKLVALFTGLVLLAGCATPHQINLDDGSTILTQDKPEFNDDSGFYEFETSEGVETTLNKDRVDSIERINN